jgi:hypothetical protein
MIKRRGLLKVLAAGLAMTPLARVVAKETTTGPRMGRIDNFRLIESPPIDIDKIKADILSHAMPVDLSSQTADRMALTKEMVRHGTIKKTVTYRRNTPFSINPE